jgi:hypothetical protein
MSAKQKRLRKLDRELKANQAESDRQAELDRQERIRQYNRRPIHRPLARSGTTEIINRAVAHK